MDCNSEEKETDSMVYQNITCLACSSRTSAFLIQLSVHVVTVIASTSSEGIVRIIAQCTVVFSNGLI